MDKSIVSEYLNASAKLIDNITNCDPNDLKDDTYDQTCDLLHHIIDSMFLIHKLEILVEDYGVQS